MSKSEDMRKRLEALNRQPLPPGADGAAPPDEADLRRRIRKDLQSKRPALPEGRSASHVIGPIVFPRDLQHRPAPLPPSALSAGPRVLLSEAVQGVEAVAPDGSRAYYVERCVGKPDGDWGKLCGRIGEALATRGSGVREQLGRIGLTDEFRVEDLIFLDLETTGLGCSPLFLIGSMVCTGKGLVVKQYFARNYTEERAAVSLFAGLAAGRRLLVSFNGKSFDLPYLRMRSAANGIVCRIDLPHLDLLHAARRIWKSALPDCRLQTLERFICGRVRGSDIPSHLIPDAYHDYVRTGNAVQMVNVLEHNFLDLITLGELIVRMPATGAEGVHTP